MSNMGYCRFENTVRDMRDCIEALQDANWDLEELSEEASMYEARAIKSFIRLCKEVSESVD